MFQFTTTTIINSDKDFTSGKPLFEADEDVLRIKRHNNFKKANVLAVYKRAASEEKKEKVSITVPSTLKKGYYRIALYVRLSGNNNSYYANDFVFKGKPFYIEFEVKSDNEAAATVAARIAENARKYMLMVYEKDLLDVSTSGSKLTIEAIDEYQRLTKVEFQKFNPEGGIKALGGAMGEYEVDSSATVTTEVEGKEGFGTYTHIVKDLRLPTAANTRWTRIIQDETPVPGAMYDQYTLYYCVNRGIMGGDAVGEVVKSRTTHVFYVNQDVTTFESELKKAFGDEIITEVEDNNSGEYDGTESLPEMASLSEDKLD